MRGGAEKWPSEVTRPMPADPTAHRASSAARHLVRLLAAAVLVATVGVVAVAVPPAPPADAAFTRAYGSEPIDDVLHWAGQYARCGLTSGKLAAMMIVPTFTESGAGTTPNEAPSPMTLSRWDTSSGLWAFGNKATPYQRAFWHPGAGMWQFDSAGGWPLTAAGAISSWSAAEQAAKVMSSRYCASTATTDIAKIRYAWGPWYACAAANETTCLGLYNEVFDGTNVWINRAYDVNRMGGAQRRGCLVAGLGAVECYRVDPALAQGNRSFASASPSIPTPITAPFYVFEAGGREYRYWLASDTGYNATISASKPLTANARTSLTWSVVTNASGLCDVDAAVGFCGGWSSWAPLSSSSASDPALARNADGRLEVVYAAGDGTVQHAWQTRPNGPWSAPVALGSLGSVASVELARDNAGFLYAFARDQSGGIWSMRQSTVDWGPWTYMGPGVSVLFDAATNADGRLELFGLDGAGAVVHQWQWSNGVWSAWERLGGPGVYAAAAGVNPDGRMELFGVNNTGTLVHSWQIPGYGWSGWASFSGVYIGKPSVETRSDGLLEVFIRGADYGMWDMAQNRSSATGWNVPQRIGMVQMSSDPVGARNADGRMEVFAGLMGGVVGNVWQVSPNGSWSDWGTLPGVAPYSVTAGAHADGRLVLISRQTSGALLISSQNN